MFSGEITDKFDYLNFENFWNNKTHLRCLHRGTQKVPFNLSHSLTGAKILMLSLENRTSCMEK